MMNPICRACQVQPILRLSTELYMYSIPVQCMLYNKVNKVRNGTVFASVPTLSLTHPLPQPTTFSYHAPRKLHFRTLALARFSPFSVSQSQTPSRTG